MLSPVGHELRASMDLQRELRYAMNFYPISMCSQGGPIKQQQGVIEDIVQVPFWVRSGLYYTKRQGFCNFRFLGIAVIASTVYIGGVRKVQTEESVVVSRFPKSTIPSVTRWLARAREKGRPYGVNQHTTPSSPKRPLD